MSDIILIGRIMAQIAAGFKLAGVLFASGCILAAIVYVTLRILAAAKRHDEMESRYRWELRKAREDWARNKHLGE